MGSTKKELIRNENALLYSKTSYPTSLFVCKKYVLKKGIMPINNKVIATIIDRRFILNLY